MDVHSKPKLQEGMRNSSGGTMSTPASFSCGLQGPMVYSLCSCCSSSGGSQLPHPLPLTFCQWEQSSLTNPAKYLKRKEQPNEGFMQYKRKNYDSSSYSSTLPSPRSATGNAGRKPPPSFPSFIHPGPPVPGLGAALQCPAAATQAFRASWVGHPSSQQAHPRAPSPPYPAPARQ